MALLLRYQYIAEVLLAELVFLRDYPRRSRFPLHLAAALAVCMGAGAAEYALRSFTPPLVSFVLMVSLLGVTAVCMHFCFQVSFLTVLSSCAAGIALQHIGHHVSRIVCLLFLEAGTWSAPAEFLSCLFLDIAAFLLLNGPLHKYRQYDSCAPQITTVSLGIILLCTGVTRFLRLSGKLNFYAVLCTSIYAIACCGLSLFIQFFLCQFIQLKSEYLLSQQLREKERSQYETSRENSELLNIKCHDLKHKLHALESHLPQAELDSMRKIIDSYDGTYHTGLDALDLILNEKSVRCLSRNITLTYMGPGEELGFMDEMDIYSLFGNILDNAITAASKTETPEKRIVSMVINRKGDFVSISVINFSEEAPVFSPYNQLPQTSKKGEPGYHGFGMRSIRSIANKYSGDVSVSFADGIFHLGVYMMRE